MDITRRDFAKSVIAGMGAAMIPEGAVAQPSDGDVKRPNIVFICTDQHSGQMLMGGPGRRVPVRTPNLERLASRGVYFTNAYNASPVCVPARAAMMTGRFASDVDSFGNTTVFQGAVPTWGNYLTDAGYRCWATGKMDLTPEKDLGFQQTDVTHEHFKRPDITELFRRPMCYRVDERQLADGSVGDRGPADKAKLDAGLKFIRSQVGATKPWVAYMGLNLPHPKFEAPQKYLDLYPTRDMPLPNIPRGYLDKELHPVFQVLRDFSMLSTPIPEEKVRRAKSAYFGMITELDDSLGAFMDELERLGMLKDTIFVYTADHGEMLGEHGLWLKRAMFEGAARIPIIMAGPGLPAGKVIDAPVSHVDLVATLLDVAGVRAPAQLRGTSLLPLMHGSATAAPRFVYAECHTEGNATGSFMIRKGDWKYLYFSFYGNNLLFNLREDPGELKNLAGKPETASIERELHDALRSIVDPDAITLRAFATQDAFLARMIREQDAQTFYQTIAGRLGKGQGALITQLHYPSWKPVDLDVTTSRKD